jgi:predicted secreted protein
MSAYADTAARLGLGVLVQLGQADGDPLASPPVLETFLNVGEVTDATKSGAKADSVDATNHQSIEGYREFISGLREAGELSVSGNWIDPAGDQPTGFTTQQDVEALFDSGERRHWRIVVPPLPGEGEVSPGYFEGTAMVSSFGDMNFAPDKLLNYSFKLKISGKFQYHATA